MKFRLLHQSQLRLKIVPVIVALSEKLNEFFKSTVPIALTRLFIGTDYTFA
jgi:hypothetical protein